MRRGVKYTPAGCTLDVSFNYGTVIDRSISNTVGTPSGSPTYTTGLVCATTQSVNYGNTSNTLLGTGNFTIVSWIKADADLLGVTYRAICGRGNTGSGEFYLYVTASNGTPGFYSQNAATPGHTTDVRGANHCVAVVRLGDNFTVYVDGVAGTADAAVGLDINNTKNFIIGNSVTRQFLGTIYRVMMWKGTALSTSNLVQLYRRGPF